MNSDNQKFKNVDDYIELAKPEARVILEKIRAEIKKAAPQAVESISYGMPAYKLNGKPLVYFAAFAHHIGLYATPEAHKKFAGELSKYKQGKGSVQFPLDKPIPYSLISQIVSYKATMLNLSNE